MILNNLQCCFIAANASISSIHRLNTSSKCSDRNLQRSEERLRSERKSRGQAGVDCAGSWGRMFQGKVSCTKTLNLGRAWLLLELKEDQVLTTLFFCCLNLSAYLSFFSPREEGTSKPLTMSLLPATELALESVYKPVSFPSPA